MKPRIVLTSLLLCIVVQNSMAQKTVTVKSFAQTTDHIPGSDRRNDLNGTPCALLKVQILDTIERVEGNRIGAIIDKGVEKWIYMCHGSRNVKIHLKNHLPVNVVFNNYQIAALEKNRVYELVLNTPMVNYKDFQGVKGNDLHLRVIPKNAIVVLWSDDMPKRMERPSQSGEMKVYLPYGRYHFSVEAGGYERKEGSLFVNDVDSVEELRLTPITGELIVNCSTKADIFVNGVKMVKAKKSKQWTGRYPIGRYVVEARAKGFCPKLDYVNVALENPAIVDFDTLISENEFWENGMLPTDEAINLRKSVREAEERFMAQAEAQRQENLAKLRAAEEANSYDVITMTDGSTILCKVADIAGNNVLFSQKSNNTLLKMPISQVLQIKYNNGEVKSFK